jgi:hypothetical protein
MNIFKLYFIFHIYYLIFEFIYALEYPKVSFNILDLLEFIMYLKISDHFLHSSNFQNYFSNACFISIGLFRLLFISHHQSN